MRKLSYGFARYLIFYLFTPVMLALITQPLTRAIFSIMQRILPAVFQTYNKITEKELYEGQLLKVYLFAGILTVLVTAYMAVAFSNEKFERVTRMTDGLYTAKEGIAFYLKEYAVCDAVTAVLVPLIFAIPSRIDFRLAENLDTETSHIGSKLEELLAQLFSQSTAFTNAVGGAAGIAILILTSFLSTAFAAYLGLLRWRGIWLSDISR